MIELCLSSHAIKFSWSEIRNVAFERGFKIQHMSVTSHICVLIVSLYRQNGNESFSKAKRMSETLELEISKSLSRFGFKLYQIVKIDHQIVKIDLIFIFMLVLRKFITHKRNVWEPSRVVLYFVIFIEKFTFFMTTNAKYHFNENVIP